MSKMKKIMVTGGSGFIGSNLIRELLGQGHNVFAVDNFFSSDEKNITEFLDHPNFEFSKHDVIEPLSREVDEIYHLAAPASPKYYQRDPIFTSKTILLGSLNQLELATKTGAKVLFSSTSEVYGDPSEHPQRESYWGNVNPIGPRACYDESKRAAETLAFDFHRQYGTRVKVARIFNTFGPGMAVEDGRVVSNLIVQALRGETLTIYGDGSQTRSLCFVDDLVQGLMLLMETKDDFVGPLNLGSGHELSVSALAEIILALSGSSSSLEYRPLPEDDPRQRRADTALANSKLNWTASTDLAVGLATTIQYFEAELAARKLK
jgi:UDP-glucuronate decarboxylase